MNDFEKQVINLFKSIVSKLNARITVDDSDLLLLLKNMIKDVPTDKLLNFANIITQVDHSLQPNSTINDLLPLFSNLPPEFSFLIEELPDLLGVIDFSQDTTTSNTTTAIATGTTTTETSVVENDNNTEIENPNIMDTENYQTCPKNKDSNKFITNIDFNLQHLKSKNIETDNLKVNDITIDSLKSTHNKTCLLDVSSLDFKPDFTSTEKKRLSTIKVDRIGLNDYTLMVDENGNIQLEHHNIFPGIDFLWKKLKQTAMSANQIRKDYPLTPLSDVINNAIYSHLNHPIADIKNNFIFVDSDLPNPEFRKKIPKADFPLGVICRAKYTPKENSNATGILSQESEDLLFRLSGSLIMTRLENLKTIQKSYLQLAISVKWCIDGNSLNMLMGDDLPGSGEGIRIKTLFHNNREFINMFPEHFRQVPEGLNFGKFGNPDDWYINTNDHLFNTYKDGSKVTDPLLLDIKKEFLIIRFSNVLIDNKDLQIPIINSEKDRSTQDGEDFRVVGIKIPSGTHLANLFIRRANGEEEEIGSFTSMTEMVCSKFQEKIHFRHHTKNIPDPEKVKFWCPFHKHG